MSEDSAPKRDDLSEETPWRSVPARQKSVAPVIGIEQHRRKISPGDQFIYLHVDSVHDHPNGVGDPIAVCTCKCGNEVELSVNRLNGLHPQKYCSQQCGLLLQQRLSPGGILEKGREVLKEKNEKKKKIREEDNLRLQEEVKALKAEVWALQQTMKGDKEPELPLSPNGTRRVDIRLPVQVWALWGIRAAKTGRPLELYLAEYFMASLAFESRKEQEIAKMEKEEKERQKNGEATK